VVEFRKPDGLQRQLGSLISRRRFLQNVGAVAAGLLAAGCCQEGLVETVESFATIPLTEVPSEPISIVLPSDVPVSSSIAQVAIARAESYDRDLVRQQVQTVLDGVGGLDDVIQSGDRVAIKVNLTGGTYFQPPSGLSATESYLTHPQVVRALGQLLRDAGAHELFIVEAVYDQESYSVFGYQDAAEALDATLINLNSAEPYSDFASTAVGAGAFVYQNFTFNHILEEVDAFVSVGKMKCHYNCGVTHAMKNLIGLVPVSHYRLDEAHWWRSAFHGESHDEAGTRLPRIIVDLNRARPIDLALIDGIKTAEGGEVPRGTFNPVSPGALFASKDPVAVDAVATAAMGFDPTAEPPAAPFLRSDNYLNLACQSGLGTNRLEEIEVVGVSINDVHHQFEPSREM
jgi:uncharacterized protein (DUF362 family)